jgi:phosphoribosylanthranilate isomerase
MTKRVRIKICGLTNAEDAILAGESGADFGGFVFHPPSPRAVDPAGAAKIVRTVRSREKRDSRRMSFVGVFVNEDPENVRRIYKECGLDIIQFHGEETPEICRAAGLPFWKAIRAKDESSIAEMEKYPGAVILVDAFRKGMYGGTGLSLDPVLARRAMAAGRRIVLAGGVSSENLREILALHPWAVDVSSSLEERPGKKSEAKMKEFFRIVHEWRDGS